MEFFKVKNKRKKHKLSESVVSFVLTLRNPTVHPSVQFIFFGANFGFPLFSCLAFPTSFASTFLGIQFCLHAGCSCCFCFFPLLLVFFFLRSPYVSLLSYHPVPICNKLVRQLCKPQNTLQKEKHTQTFVLKVALYKLHSASSNLRSSSNVPRKCSWHSTE